MIRILIVDDHPIVRNGLRKLFSHETDIEVVGEACDGQQAIHMVQELDPDVVLLDLRMPNMDGLATLQVLQQLGKKSTRVVILTASEDKSEFIQAMKLGCSGIVLKQTPQDLIVKCVRKVHDGEIWLDSHTMAEVMKEFSTGSGGNSNSASGLGLVAGGWPAPLTNSFTVGTDGAPKVTEIAARGRSPLSIREKEIVNLVAQGYKNKEMAEKLFISEQTVKNHLHNIFEKLGVSDRLELALYAIHNGLHLGNDR